MDRIKNEQIRGTAKVELSAMFAEGRERHITQSTPPCSKRHALPTWNPV